MNFSDYLLPLAMSILLLNAFAAFWKSIPPAIPKKDQLLSVLAAMYMAEGEESRSNPGDLYLTERLVKWNPWFPQLSLYAETTIPMAEIQDVSIGRRSSHKPWHKPLVVSTATSEYRFYFETPIVWRHAGRQGTWVEAIRSRIRPRGFSQSSGD
jgi:hypothetical protein